MTAINPDALLASLTEGVSAVRALVDGGIDFIPEVAMLRPYIDGADDAIRAINAIVASKAALVAKLAAAQVALADTATDAAETAKFGPKP